MTENQEGGQDVRAAEAAREKNQANYRALLRTMVDLRMAVPGPDGVDLTVPLGEQAVPCNVPARVERNGDFFLSQLDQLPEDRQIVLGRGTADERGISRFAVRFEVDSSIIVEAPPSKKGGQVRLDVFRLEPDGRIIRRRDGGTLLSEDEQNIVALALRFAERVKGTVKRTPPKPGALLWKDIPEEDSAGPKKQQSPKGKV